jgi:N-acetylmuramoyl-L-alanine amidase
MKPLPRPAIAVRLKRWGVALASLALLTGCSGRRTVLRPVYGAPATVVAPAQAPCATADPAPAFGDPGDLSNSPPSAPVGPVKPKTDNVVPQSGTTEPSLYPNPAPASGETPPPLSGPQAKRQTNRRSAVGAGARNDGVRDRVSGFVQEPDDLFLPPKADRTWKYIVLHHSDHATGSYAQIDRDHRDRLGTQGCGYHFVVGNGSESPDGRVEIASRWLNQKAGAHCRDAKTADANDYGIGVCLIGDMDENPPTTRQIEATKALVAYLRERYDIPAERIVTHAAIAQTATACPGKLFPFEAIAAGPGFAAR